MRRVAASLERLKASPSAKGELAPKHGIEGPDIAVDLDTLDIDLRRRDDPEGNIHGEGFLVLCRRDIDIHEWLPGTLELTLDRLAGLNGRDCVENVAGFEFDQFVERLGIDLRQFGDKGDFPEVVALTFTDRKGDHETGAAFRQGGNCGQHLEIRITPACVVPAEQCLVGLQTTGVEEIGGGKDPVPGGLAGVDDPP